MADAYTDKALPPEVLAVLPLDGHLQIELAHSITCHAYAQKVSKLEAEAEQLQSNLVQSQQTVNTLERRLAGMEAELVEHQQRARQSMTEQHKLVAEKNALIETVKRLNREVAKLEHFKRNLLQQLQEDTEAEAPGSSAYAVVDMTTDRLVSEVLHSADGIAAAVAAAGGPGTSSHVYQQQHYQQQQPLGAGYQQRQGQHAASGHGRWSPPVQGNMVGGAGKLQGAGSPGSNTQYGGMGYSTHTAAAGGDGSGGNSGSSPYRGGLRSASSAAKEAVLGSKAGIPAASTAGPTAAGGVAAGGQLGAAAGSNSSTGRGLAAAANMVGPRFSSPPQAATGRAAAAAGRPGGATSPRIDGKEFFRQARARLSYEQFSQFLVAIKDLNAGRTSREDTLGSAKALFGSNNTDLYGLFEGLLMRHLTTF